MEQRLEGKVALITGASSGIGAATARRLAELGATVVLAGRRLDRLTALAEEIESRGGKAYAAQADVAERDQVEALVENTREQHGRIDVLVNNAGLMLLAAVADADLAEWDRMVQVNLLGLMHATKTVLPVMKAQGGGHIVNVSSLAGRLAMPGGSAYSVTKFGVNAFSEALRKETVGDRIRVTVVEPGPVATELKDHITDKTSKERMTDVMSRIEPLDGDDVAGAIAYAVTQPERVNVNEILLTPIDYVR